MLLQPWRAVSFLLLCLAAPSLSASSQAFENTAIVRTVELDGSLVHVTTTYAIKALEAGSQVYTIALSDEEWLKTSWLQPKVKGQPKVLPFAERFDSSEYVELHIHQKDSLSS